jgi:PAS domain-containing protein
MGVPISEAEGSRSQRLQPGLGVSGRERLISWTRTLAPPNMRSSRRPSTGEILWSEETFRIFQYDRSTKPTIEVILQRIHPEDAALVRETIDRASQDGKNFEHEYRLVMPDGAVKHVHVVAHAERDESGNLELLGW